MNDHCYEIFQVAGSSNKSIGAAIDNAITHVNKARGARSGQTHQNMAIPKSVDVGF